MSRFLLRHCLRCGALVRGQSTCAGCTPLSSEIYGADHRRYRQALLAALRSSQGAACGICGEWMAPDESPVELDHVTPVADGGASGERRLVHAKCNSSQGGKRGQTYSPNRRRKP